jgi:hypothetical protein
LFPIVPGKQRFQEKDSISLPPPHATYWDKPDLLVSFFGRGQKMGAPTDNVRCSTTSICMVMWKLTTLLETFSCFYDNKDVRISWELVSVLCCP